MSIKNKNINSIVVEAEKIISKKDTEIQLLRTELKKANGEKTVTFKMPDHVEVRNFPALQKVEIQNQKQIQDVNVLNLKDMKIEKVNVDFPEIQNVRITNFSDIKESEKTEKSLAWIPSLIEHSLKILGSNISQLWAKGIMVRVDDEDKLRPQAVIVVDNRGKPINFSNMGSVVIPMPNSPGGNPPPTKIYAGHLTLTTSPLQLSSTIKVCRKVIITALATNAGFVYVGDATVSPTSGSETGAMLTPTGSITIEIDDLSKVYAVAETAGDIISFTYQR